MHEGGNVDVAEPPRIVLENPQSCSDAGRVDAALHHALASARAPGHAWVVAMSVERTDSRQLRAEADISDDHGTPVAHRTLSEKTTGTGPDHDAMHPVGSQPVSCEGLARAVGVWASLVLEELARAHDAPAPAAAPAPAKPAESPKPAASTEAPADSLWPAPAPHEKPSPEADWYLHHDDHQHTLEVGVGAFLMAGGGTSAVAGVTPYFVFEGGSGLFLRTALFAGQTWTALAPPSHVDATWFAGRVDTCLRLPGLYNDHRGIQLDLCAGPEAGMATGISIANSGTTTSIPYAAVGPSVDLRGELGGDLAVVIRAVGGYNIVQSSLAPDPSPAFARAELGFSWGFR